MSAKIVRTTEAPREFVHDAQAHTYSLDGISLRSITDTLGDLGFADYGFLPKRESEFYKLRGRAVADATHYYDEGDLDWPSLKETVIWDGEERPWVLGFVRGYEKFRKKYPHLSVVVAETPFYDPTWRFAGRPDRLFENTLEGHLEVWQIKCGKVEPWVAIQTAGEKKLLTANGYENIKKRFGLELKSDGTYAEPVPFDDLLDEKVFLAALAVAKWKANHK